MDCVHSWPWRLWSALLSTDGIDVNKAETNHGWTPLYAACHHGHVEVVNAMLSTDGIMSIKISMEGHHCMLRTGGAMCML